jgi:hypothetical protein
LPKFSLIACATFLLVIACQVEPPPAASSGLQLYNYAVHHVHGADWSTRSEAFWAGSSLNEQGVDQGFVFCANPQNPLWNAELTGSNPIAFHAVRASHTSGCIAVGVTQSKGWGIERGDQFSDAYAVRLNAQGQILWEVCDGDTLNDAYFDALEDVDGNWFALGTALLDRNRLVLLSKISNEGQLIWSRRYLVGGFENVGQALAWSSDGTLLAAGYLAEKVFLLKLDPENGDVQFLKISSRPTQNLSLLNQLQPKHVSLAADQGGIYLGTTGFFGLDCSEVNLMKFGLSGDLEWDLVYGRWPNAVLEKIALSPMGWPVLLLSQSSQNPNLSYPGGFSNRRALLTRLDGAGALRDSFHFGSTATLNQGLALKLEGETTRLLGSTYNLNRLDRSLFQAHLNNSGQLISNVP